MIGFMGHPHPRDASDALQGLSAPLFRCVGLSTLSATHSLTDCCSALGTTATRYQEGAFSGHLFEITVCAHSASPRSPGAASE